VRPSTGRGGLLSPTRRLPSSSQILAIWPSSSGQTEGPSRRPEPPGEVPPRSARARPLASLRRRRASAPRATISEKWPPARSVAPAFTLAWTKDWMDAAELSLIVARRMRPERPRDRSSWR
jgi:hypothetical protein